MPRDQNAGRSHNVKIVIGPLKGCKSSNIWGKSQRINILFRQKLRESLLPFGAESYVFQLANQKYKGTQNYNLPVVLYGCETWSLLLRE